VGLEISRATYEFIETTDGALYTPETPIDALNQQIFLDPSLVSCAKGFRPTDSQKYELDVIVYDAYNCPLAKETVDIDCECDSILQD